MSAARPRVLGWAISTAVIVGAGTIAYAHRQAIVDAVRLIDRARPLSIALALAVVGLLYLCRALVYSIPLRLMRYRVPHPFLWETAIVASSLQQALPTAGAVGYGFIAWAFHRHGVPIGQASLIALIDTLSYAFATATLVIASIVYLAIVGGLHPGALAVGFGPGLAAVLLGFWVYRAQRNERRFVALVDRIGRCAAALLHLHWNGAGVRGFLGEYYRGKAMIANDPRSFARMIALQYATVSCDAATLWLSFAALGAVPPVWIVFLGFTVSLAAGAFISAPAGGGSFEVVLSVFFVAHGVEESHAIATALLFRFITFWVPLAVSLALLVHLRRAQSDIRRERSAPRTAGSSRRSA